MLRLTRHREMVREAMARGANAIVSLRVSPPFGVEMVTDLNVQQETKTLLPELLDIICEGTAVVIRPGQGADNPFGDIKLGKKQKAEEPEDLATAIELLMSKKGDKGKDKDKVSQPYCAFGLC
jgi:hypothetical protein